MCSYKELLQSKEWEIKRHWIMHLDHYHCRKCGKSAYSKVLKPTGVISNDQRSEIMDEVFLINEEDLPLNVHHKYYIDGKKPWEYPDEALVTLCPECHKAIHEREVILVLNIDGTEIYNCIVCSKCDGYGYIPEYYHVESGICFKCWGEGVIIDKLG